MTQDCSDSLFTASADSGLPKGINVVGTDADSGPGIEDVSRCEREPRSADPSKMPDSWSYLMLHPAMARNLRKWIEAYNAVAPEEKRQRYFVHESARFTYKNKVEEKGVKKIVQPTVSGLVFLQGTVRRLQIFLKENFPQYHLVNDCSRKRPASIRDTVMQPFMDVMRARPEQITFLREPFERFARDHIRLRLLTGPFKGREGYVVRIDRDRQLVFDFGGLAVAIRGVHNEDFIAVE